MLVVAEFEKIFFKNSRTANVFKFIQNCCLKTENITMLNAMFWVVLLASNRKNERISILKCFYCMARSIDWITTKLQLGGEKSVILLMKKTRS